MPWWLRSEVTSSRVQRFPIPVTDPLRVRTPAIVSSEQMRTSTRTASTNLLRRVSSAVAASSARNAKLRVHAALPVDDRNDLGCLAIYIHHYLFDQDPYDALFQASIGFRMTPHGLQVARQGLELFSRRGRDLPVPHHLLDPHFELLDLLQSVIPPTLQFASD